MLKAVLFAGCALLLSATSVVAATLIVEPADTQPLPRPEIPPPPSGELVRTIKDGSGTTKIDVSGKGAVLCTWSILTAVQATTEACGWKRLPVDAAIDAAIADMDKYIIDNMPTPITQGDLDEQKRHDREGVWGVAADQIALMCELSSETDTYANFASGMRQIDPATLATSIQDTLSIPREPVMNPCL